MKIGSYGAPMMVTWKLTRDCDLSCLHCCTDSAPGRALPGELTRSEALDLAAQIVEAQIPYVMLVGGEPTTVPHFYEVAEVLGRGGVFLKIETNGQHFGEPQARRLSCLPIRSIQVSIDGATQPTYAKMRPQASLEAAKEACRNVRHFGMGLEITFAPARFNIHEAADVISLALELGAFRFNTGRLMRLGTAAKLWDRLVSCEKEYEKFYKLLKLKEKELAGRMELCFRPFSIKDEIAERSAEPSGTLLVLPDGKVKVTAALPYLCADFKKDRLIDAWKAYRAAWNHPLVLRGLKAAAEDDLLLAKANEWVVLKEDLPALLV